MRSTASEPEVLDGYVPPPYVPPATLDERVAKVWREVSRTPGRAALATLDVCTIAAFAVSLRTIPITTSDSVGPLRAHCGVGFYVAGASNRAVDTACRYAFASRVPDLLVLGLVSVITTAVLVRTIAYPPPAEAKSRVRRLWQEVARTPARAALATFDLAALVAAIAASQPITVATADGVGPLSVHCGLQYYVLGAANAAVRNSCRRAYGPRAAVFFATLAALVVGTAGLMRTLKRATRGAQTSFADEPLEKVSARP